MSIYDDNKPVNKNANHGGQRPVCCPSAGPCETLLACGPPTCLPPTHSLVDTWPHKPAALKHSRASHTSHHTHNHTSVHHTCVHVTHKSHITHHKSHATPPRSHNTHTHATDHTNHTLNDIVLLSGVDGWACHRHGAHGQRSEYVWSASSLHSLGARCLPL